MPKVTRLSILALAFAGCLSPDEPDIPPSTTTTAAPLTATGMERLIPIRFTIIRDCLPTTSPCETELSLFHLSEAVEVANRVFAPAGIQLYIERIDEVDAPNLQTAYTDNDDPDDDPQPVAFSAVEAELREIFDDMPDGNVHAYTAGTTKAPISWMHALTALYEDDRRLHVWVTPYGTQGSKSPYPQGGRGLQMTAENFKDSKRHFFAHEFGHYMGLPHPFDLDDLTSELDPETMQTWKLADAWDLVYKPGTGAANPHTYYTNRSAALLDEADLELLERRLNPGVDNITSCDIDNPNGGIDLFGKPPGTVICAIGSGNGYAEIRYTNDAPMFGIAREYPDDTRGKNLMSYDTADGSDTMPVFLSESQIRMVRKNLRWDVPFHGATKNGITAGFLGTVPDLGGRRPRLGHARAGEPAPRLDFDADGQRDIGYWLAPRSSGDTGEFRILLSSQNYSPNPGSVLVIALGKAGDVPAPADYNGDGRTDVAVYQAGGGINRTDLGSTVSYWRYCLTNTLAPLATTCATDGVAVQFGLRGDVPLYGHQLDGVAGDELMLYRASTGHFYGLNVAGTYYLDKAVGYAGTGAVPLPGLYDCDNITDLAVYEPAWARFRLRASADGWTATVTQQFDDEMVPYPSGEGEERAAPIALSGMVSLRCGTPSSPPKARRAAALWYPPAGQWNIIWNPTAAGGTIDQCGYGGGATDTPITGIDTNTDGRSDLTLFRPQTATNASGTFYTKVAVSGSCNGGSTSQPCVGCGADVRAWGQPDITGDSKADIMIFDHYNGAFRRYKSETSFSTYTGGSVGGLTGQML